MKKKLGLLKINNQTFFPTELFQKIPTVDLDLKNKYDAFVFGVEATNNFEKSIKEKLHYYYFYKQDLTKSPTDVTSKLSKWTSKIINKDVTLLSTNVYGNEGINPVTLTHLSMKSLIENTLNKLTNINKEIKVKIVFSQPPFEKANYKNNYYKNFLKAVKLTSESLKVPRYKNIIFDFPDVVSKQYFIYEQYAAFDFFAAQANILENKKEGNYLIIDAGALTTDIAIIRRSKSSGEINYKNKPTFLTIDIGGQFLDKKILELINSKYNLSLDNNNELHLLKKIDEARINTNHQTDSILVLFKDEKYEVSYYEIEKIYEEYFAEINNALTKIKHSATKTYNLKKEIVINKIFITGGLSNDLYFKKIINKTLKGKININNIVYSNNISPSSVVSAGLAIEYLHGKEKLVPISKFEGHFVSDQKEKIFFKRKYEDLELNILFYLEELSENSLNETEYSPHTLDFPLSDITVSIKSDIDVDFDSRNVLKVPLKKIINAKKKILYSNKIETIKSNGVISLNYKPFFYTYNKRGAKQKISNDIKQKFEFKDGRKNNNNDYDILLAIDFGMANSSVAVVADEKYLNNDNFYFIDVFKENKQTENFHNNDKLNNILLETINQNNVLLQQLTSKISTIESRILENNMNNKNNSKTCYEYYEEIIDDPIQEKIDIEEYKKVFLLENDAPNKNKIFEKFSEYLKSNNKLYDEKTIYSFIQAIYSNSNYLIILAGPPGVGKSSLISSFNKFLISDYILSDIDLFSLIPVAPNWFSVENLVGNYNEFSDKPEIKPFSKLIAYALNIERKFEQASPPIIALLDEFNIAQPELYLSSILSKMEADEKDRKISIRDKGEEFYELEIPKNFRIVGTINIDAASKNLSPKILDRAHFIRVNPDYKTIKTFFENITKKNTSELKTQLIENKSIRKKSLLEFCFETALSGGSFLSFRTMGKIANYIIDVTSNSTLSTDKHIDIILSEFIFPKFPANNHFNNTKYSENLELLKGELSKNEDFRNSKRIIERMINSKMPGQFV